MASTITDWFMVGITLIYVIATICIYRANNESAKATREQLEESKVQFEESHRLQCMPFLQMDVSIGKPTQFVTEVSLCTGETDTTLYKTFRIRNLGNGTAVNTVYEWSCKSLNVWECDAAPFNAIMVGDEYYWQFTIFALKCEYESAKVTLDLEYQDLLGNTYNQKFYISFDRDSCLTDGILIETDAPILYGS